MTNHTEQIREVTCGEDVQDKRKFAVSPCVGMEFSSHEEAYDFYNAYAKSKGFGIRRGHADRSKKDNEIITRYLVCDKEGLKYLKDKREEGKNIHRKADVRECCNAKMVIGLERSSGIWIVRKLDEDHSHLLTTPSKVSKHHSHQTLHRAPTCHKFIDNLDGKGIRPSTICKVINVTHGSEEEFLTQQQCQSHLRRKRKSNIGQECVSIIRHFQEKMTSDPQFYFAMELDYDQTVRSFFWADGRARTSYLQFGDVVVFDTTYRTNNMRLPFAPFTGVNHHRQSTLFGCALLADETEETFVWLFEQWLKCMSGIKPLTIITDQDKAMCGAIHKVFPQTRHRFCSWHLGRSSLQNLQSLRSLHGEEISIMYQKWYWSSTHEKFEMRWKEIKDKCSLDERNWLTNLYNQRRHWASLYLKDTFAAGMTSTQRSEGINAYFDGYVNAQTELCEFVRQFDEAIGARRAAELDADFRSTNYIPLLSTTHPIEKQARACYTRTIFDIFQQEFNASHSLLHEKLSKNGFNSKYAVWAMDDEENNKKRQIVVFDAFEEVSVNCTCAKFETEGILCKHSLHILLKKQMLAIPASYIMRRWTMDARHVGRGVVRNNIANSEEQVFIIKHWELKVKCNKALEGAKVSEVFHNELDAMLDEFVEKVENDQKQKAAEELGIYSNEMPMSSILVTKEQASQITIRDPDGPVKTKGRPTQVDRIKAGIEISQEKGIKKQRTCGFCKEKGHYITSCHLVKVLDSNLKLF